MLVQLKLFSQYQIFVQILLLLLYVQIQYILKSVTILFVIETRFENICCDTNYCGTNLL